ncbi:hypothetical protein M9Y10_039601 [Tritrichomonas musculus]|uniref:Uncharacterized protein n=1 Tax=Tritrichomonas musculus TaxID=1915356 RepID=A0ABR2KCA4_9EUKA
MLLLDREVSLLPLFQSIHRLSPSKRSLAYDMVLSRCHLTTNAMLNFDDVRDAVESESKPNYCSLNTLKKIIRIWNPDYDLSGIKLERRVVDPIDEVLDDKNIDELIRELAQTL